MRACVSQPEDGSWDTAVTLEGGGGDQLAPFSSAHLLVKLPLLLLIQFAEN